MKNTNDKMNTKKKECSNLDDLTDENGMRLLSEGRLRDLGCEYVEIEVIEPMNFDMSDFKTDYPNFEYVLITTKKEWRDGVRNSAHAMICHNLNLPSKVELIKHMHSVLSGELKEGFDYAGLLMYIFASLVNFSANQSNRQNESNVYFTDFKLGSFEQIYLLYCGISHLELGEFWEKVCKKREIANENDKTFSSIHMFTGNIQKLKDY